MLRVMTQADYIIAKFGGLNALARATRKPLSTVQGWRERGSIPERRWKEILEAAQESGVEMCPTDFVAHIKAESCTRVAVS